MKAKYLFLTALLLATLNMPSFAQPKNEIKLGYGLASGTEFAVSLGSAIGTALGAGISIAVGDVISVLINGVPTNVTITNIETGSKFWGTFHLSYNHFLSRRFSLGVQGNYNPMRIDHLVSYSNGTTSRTSEKYDFISLYGRMDFHYVLRPKFQMYSGIMAGGIMDVNDTSNSLSFAAHLNALGFRFGQTHALFAEFGIGLGPIISLGYSVRF